VFSYLHSQSPPIIYRDLKPGNIMLSLNRKTVKLIDFGIARTYKQQRSKDTIAMGTPGYSPPEQYGKGQTDHRSDIYALGATLHHLLTLRDPGDEPFQFPDVTTINSDVPDVWKPHHWITSHPKFPSPKYLLPLRQHLGQGHRHLWQGLRHPSHP
jgi:serine/threonine-protein kinase